MNVTLVFESSNLESKSPVSSTSTSSSSSPSPESWVYRFTSHEDQSESRVTIKYQRKKTTLLCQGSKLSEKYSRSGQVSHQFNYTKSKIYFQNQQTHSLLFCDFNQSIFWTKIFRSYFKKNNDNWQNLLKTYDQGRRKYFPMACAQIKPFFVKENVSITKINLNNDKRALLILCQHSYSYWPAEGAI